MKKIKNNLIYTSLGLLLVPNVSFAALSGIKSLLGEIKNLLTNDIRIIVVSLAFIYFFWGVGQFILHSDDQKAREEGKQKMIWGVVALFVITAIGGILIAIGQGFDIPVNTNY
ncbi:MAG: hypothetical protein WCW47_01745 [Candidatus Paceibacterota bacterium]|jgi:hypothetical protein